MKKKTINDVTLCFTMGGRPDLLERSIDSIQERWDFQHVVAVNDFADPLCDEVFLRKFPHGVLLSDGKKRGHHGAIDWLYAEIKTEFIFHTEDDWIFPQDINFDEIKRILNSDEKIVSYCFRFPGDFLESSLSEGLVYLNVRSVGYANLTGIDGEWYGYTFNPHLIKKSTISQIGLFSQYKKERHISRALKKQGGYVAYAALRLCEHIGEGLSVANPNAGKKKSAIRIWLRKKINTLKLK